METRCKEASIRNAGRRLLGGATFNLVALAAAAMVASVTAVANPRQQSRTGEEQLAPTDMDVWLRRLVGRYRVEGALNIVFKDPEYEKRACGAPPPDPAPPVEPLCRSVKGAVDCTGIGAGPGVQCMFNVVWPDLYEVVFPEPEQIAGPMGGVYELPGGVSNLSPAMALFGIDPGRGGINYLLVDHKGLPEGGLGYITGNRATFTTPCVNTPSLFNAMRLKGIDDRATKDCDRIIHFDAKADSRVVIMSVEIEINGMWFTSLQMTLRRLGEQD